MTTSSTPPARRKTAGTAPRPRAGPAHRVRRWRRAAELAQAVSVLGLPFLRVNGESALRFDVPALRLHVFGATVWMDELFVVLAGTLALTFAFLLATVLFGRLWCGWGCPQTALLDLTGWFDRARRSGGWRAPAAHGALALASAVVAADLLWYFVEPADFFRRLAGGTLGPVVTGSWIVGGALVFADLAFWRYGFCATTCPYAKLQGALLDRRSLVIAYDARRSDDCVKCKACVRVCPVGIDIRDGLQAACTSCAECVDACRPIMERLGRAPHLVGYFFGAPGTPRRLLRPAALALAGATAASIALTVAVAADRTALEVTVTGAGDVARRTASGESFLQLGIALENRGREPLHVALSLSVPGVAARIRPEHAALGAGEHRRIQAVAVLRTERGGTATGELSADASTSAGPSIHVARSVTLALPGAAP